MIYGLYLSAGGVIANSHRQDVIANNLANVETTGFKRDVSLFEERLTEAQRRRAFDPTNPLLEPIGGGMFPAATFTDRTQGDLEETGNNLDVGISGNGYLAVQDGTDVRLTRDGRMLLDREGFLILADNGKKVLGKDLKPIQLQSQLSTSTEIGSEGEIRQQRKVVAQLGVFDVDDSATLQKLGGNLFATDAKNLSPASGQVRGGFIERANVDPATELTQLMECQRQLEANANMIRFQDQSLQKLVNEVGKIN